jgi:hypothetical protein
MAYSVLVVVVPTSTGTNADALRPFSFCSTPPTPGAHPPDFSPTFFRQTGEERERSEREDRAGMGKRGKGQKEREDAGRWRREEESDTTSDNGRRERNKAGNERPSKTKQKSETVGRLTVTPKCQKEKKKSDKQRGTTKRNEDRTEIKREARRMTAKMGSDRKVAHPPPDQKKKK